MVLDDLDAFFLRVLELPRRGLEVRSRTSRDDLDVLPTQPPGRSAAVHRRVPDTDDEHTLTNAIDVTKVHIGQPFDADEDLIGLVPPRQLELLPLRRAAADEDRVIAVAKQSSHTRHRCLVPDVDTHVQYDLRLLIEHCGRETERRNVHAHKAASAQMLLIDHDLIAKRHEVVRNRERSRAGADERDALAILLRGNRGQELVNVVPQIGGDALQSADRDRFAVDATAATRGLTRSIARPAENSRKDVRFPIEQIRFRVAPLRNETDVLRHIRVRRARPLAVDNFMVVLRITDVGGHSSAAPRSGLGLDDRFRTEPSQCVTAWVAAVARATAKATDPCAPRARAPLAPASCRPSTGAIPRAPPRSAHRIAEALAPAPDERAPVDPV